jgi:hypothetical protein
MLSARQPNLLRRLAGFVRAVVGAALLSVLCAGLGLAQAQGGPAIPNGSPVTFQLIAQAPRHASHDSVRVRRFLDHGAQLVQVREQLTVQADGTSDPAFKLEFLDVVSGSSSAGTARTQWSEVYRKHAGLLHMHGGFRVTDVALAQQNYQLFDFGAAQRIGRAVRRVIVYPNVQDKGIWLVDLDVETGVVLYCGEYDSRLQLVSELETTSFTRSGTAMELGPRTGGKPAWSWRPKMQVNRFQDFAGAAAQFSVAPLQPAVGVIVGDYSQRLVQVTEDPVNGDRTLVLGYTDGVDEFFVLQTQGSDNPFLNNPAVRNVNATDAHAIASYDDASMRAYIFHESGTTYWVVGSGSLERLRDVSMRVCRQAVTGN